MGELAIIDVTGDTKFEWDINNDIEVEEAKKTFKRLKKKGYIAYTLKGFNRKGDILHSFDPKAGRIIMVPGVEGG